MKNGAEKMAFPVSRSPSSHLALFSATDETKRRSQDFDADELIKLIQELVRIDDRWIPTEPGCSLYIRPTMIGTRASLGVGPSTEVLLYVMYAHLFPLPKSELTRETSSCSPVAKYYASGAKPISLLCNSKEKIRAWPGGTGDCKFGSNYGPVVEKQIEAAQRGYQQVLWIFEGEKEDALVTEVGMQNAFFAFKLQDGGESSSSNEII